MQAVPPTSGSSSRAAGADGALIAPEVSSRVGSILDSVEREATQLRTEARSEARAYLDAARRHVDELVRDRQQRIEALSGEIVRRGEAVLARLDDAGPVRAGFDDLVRTLGESADRLAAEVEEMHLGAARNPPHWQLTPQLDLGEPARPQAAALQPGAGGGEPAYDSARLRGPWSGPGGAAEGRPHAPQPPAHHAAARAPRPYDPIARARALAVQIAASGASRAQARIELGEQLGFTIPERVLDELFGAGSAEDARVPWAR